MSPGTRGRAAPRVASGPSRACPSSIRFNGGFIFAEHPSIAAPEARIIWQAELDPGILRVVAVPVGADDPDGIEFDKLRPWLDLTVDAYGREHAVLSDGWNRIRLDVEAGSIATGEPVLLHYRLQGVNSLVPKILPLRRLLDVSLNRRFAAFLFPVEPRTARWLTLLRVHDALIDGASQREIGEALFGEQRIDEAWNGPSDSLRSRVRRLVRDARAMARGEYKFLLRWRNVKRQSRPRSQAIK